MDFLGYYCPYQEARTLGDRLRLRRMHRGLSRRALWKMPEPAHELAFPRGSRDEVAPDSLELADVLSTRDPRLREST